MTDQSNGYEGVAAEFLAGRGRAPSTAIGTREVRSWARTLPRGATVIDLGCGFGNDTLYLTERGYQVISCDYSMEALNRLKYFIDKPEPRFFNMLDGMPFENDSARVLISDLSIHYFSWDETCRIIKDISRVLSHQGYLLCRVNSTKDVNHGAGRGIEIENNYFNVDGKFKRFFERTQILKLFTDWEILYLNEYEMNRYQEPKIVWEIALKNIKERSV
jgi:SAM-dependent methyltransferase